MPQTQTLPTSQLAKHFSSAQGQKGGSFCFPKLLISNYRNVQCPTKRASVKVLTLHDKSTDK